MNCEKYINLMSRYLDDELSIPEKDHWEKHLHDCEECSSFFKGFKSSMDLKKYLQDKPCPPNIKVKVTKLVDELLSKKHI